jgi:HTH-type transcriptional regulator / antitoxin HipB
MDYPLRLVSQLRAHLQALRKQRGLTQAQLGKRLGLSQVRIAEIEANPGVVSVDQLARILSALGATLVLRDLAVEAAPKPAAVPPSTAESSRGPRRAGAKDSPTPLPPAMKPAARATTRKTAAPAMPPLAPKKGSW